MSQPPPAPLLAPVPMRHSGASPERRTHAEPGGQAMGKHLAHGTEQTVEALIEMRRANLTAEEKLPVDEAYFADWLARRAARGECVPAPRGPRRGQGAGGATCRGTRRVRLVRGEGRGVST